jgi:maltose O-acetyltransferase
MRSWSSNANRPPDPERMTKRIKRAVGLIGYYGFARYLPNHSEIGRRTRGFFCRMIFRKCGRDINIGRGVYFGKGTNIEIGNESGIGSNSCIYGVSGGGEVVIGDTVMIAPYTIILTLSHRFKGLKRELANDATRVSIGSWSWIGIRSIIMPGVNIGTYSIVGAGAIVTKDIPPYVVAAGVPARIIQNRIPPEGGMSGEEEAMLLEILGA